MQPKPFLANEPAWVNRYAFYILLLLVFLVSAAIQFYAQPGVDQSWFALMTRRMLDGSVPYRDMADPNLPLVLWLYSLPVALARHTALLPAVAVKLGAVVLIGASLGLYALLLRRSSVWQGATGRSLLLAIACILLLADTDVIFAQREQLLIVFFLPYLLMNLPSAAPAPRHLRILIGLLAAVGLCLKPHFFILWFVALAWKLRQKRWPIQSEDIAIGVATLAYIAAILIFTPDYLPLIRVVSRIYGQVGLPGETNAEKALWLAMIAGGGGIIFWVFGLARPAHRDVAYLTWMATGAYLEALVQFKSWAYIAYPFLAIGMLAVAMTILLKQVNDFLAFAVMAWLFYPLTPWADNRAEIDSKGYAHIQQAMALYSQSHDFYYLGLTPPPPQSFRADPPLAWAGKFNRLFELPVIMEPLPESGQPSLTPRPGMEDIEHWMLDNIATNLEAKKPDLLILDHHWNEKFPMSESFDMLVWLNKNPRLTAILSHYTLRDEFEMRHDPAHPHPGLHSTWRIFTRN